MIQPFLVNPNGHFEPLKHSESISHDDDVVIEIEAFALSRLDIKLAQANGVAPSGGVLGSVINTGDAAASLFGKRVVTAATQPCGECSACRKAVVSACVQKRILGRTHHGAAAGSIIARGRYVVPLEDGLESIGPEGCLLGQHAGDIYGLFAKGGITTGAHVVLIGNTSVTRLALSVARAMGIKAIAANPNVSASLEEARAKASELEFDQRPRWIVMLEASPAHFELCQKLSTQGSNLMTRNNTPLPDSINLVPWLNQGGTIIPLEGMHPELISELAALCAKGHADFKPHCRILPWSEIRIDTLDSELQQAEELGQFLVLN